ncbi:sigma-70 family RNA polymerase sigma factor [Tissierella sp.]|uniref:RNA polymerase sigma factor n=1 Tax=Tissierella sp. TaxID=41274 RepID=UPI002861BAC8|nr:sigma-70 family RNA polymerase sigma factor [Tissierella sp.]MDR7857510.1 sigma-70 family RNA polymerase sigma factor [Tissierella sp.]
MFNELFEKARVGDMEAKEKIIKRLQPLILSSIRKYFNKGNEYEDLIQDGNIKILECINDYDSTKGVYFLGYVKTMLRYLYLDKHKIKIHTSLNETIADGETEILDLLVSEEQDILESIIVKEDNKKLVKALYKLTDRQREIISLYYIKNMGIQDIADKLGISYRTVVNIKGNALEKMRKGQ